MSRAVTGEERDRGVAVHTHTHTRTQTPKSLPAAHPPNAVIAWRAFRDMALRRGGIARLCRSASRRREHRPTTPSGAMSLVRGWRVWREALGKVDRWGADVFTRSRQHLSGRRPLATEAAAASGGGGVDVVSQFAGVAGRYAGALYHVARRMDQMAQVTADVQRMQALRRSAPTLDRFLANPTLSRGVKRSALEEVMRAGDIQSPLVRNWLLMIADNGRLADAARILDTFESVVSAQRGSVEATVTSALPLTEWQLGMLRLRLKRRFFSDLPDAQVELKSRTDPLLLGGFTVQLGDKFIDLSVRTEVRRLKEAIMQQSEERRLE